MAVKTSSLPPIISLSEFDESTNVLVYGFPGCGKTVLMGTGEKMLILGAETGTISAKRQGSKADVWPIANWDDFEEATRWVRKGGYKKYRWIGLDSLTVLNDYAMRYCLDRAVADNASRDLDLPAIQDHFKVQNMMKRMTTVYCDLPVNVMFTAHTMTESTEEGEEIVLPQILGKKGAIAQFVVGQMSCVGYMAEKKNRAKKEVRRIYWKKNGPYIGKDRYGCLAPFTDDLTLPELEARIESSGNSETRATGNSRRRAASTRTATRASSSTTRRTATRRTRRATA